MTNFMNPGMRAKMNVMNAIPGNCTMSFQEKYDVCRGLPLGSMGGMPLPSYHNHFRNPYPSFSPTNDFDINDPEGCEKFLRASQWETLNHLRESCDIKGYLKLKKAWGL